MIPGTDRNLFLSRLESTLNALFVFRNTDNAWMETTGKPVKWRRSPFWFDCLLKPITSMTRSTRIWRCFTFERATTPPTRFGTISIRKCRSSQAIRTFSSKWPPTIELIGRTSKQIGRLCLILFFRNMPCFFSFLFQREPIAWKSALVFWLVCFPSLCIVLLVSFVL